MNAKIKLARQVLSYWHKVEFFASTDLEELRGSESGTIAYYADELVSDEDGLPWLNRENIRRAGESFRPENRYRFKLYLGVFERGDIFRVARETYPSQSEEWLERSQDGGRSCVLTAVVDEDGKLQRDSVEVSTAPWVLGAMQQGTLESVCQRSFEESTERLRHQLNTLLTVADNIKSELRLPLRLTPAELIQMLKLLGSWTCFEPRGKACPAVMVQLLLPTQEGQKFEQTDYTSMQSAISTDWKGFSRYLLERIDQEKVATVPADMESHDVAVDSGERESSHIEEVSVLNSFYIDDLERVMADIDRTGLSPDTPLARFLGGEVPRQPDLLTRDGQAIIRDAVAIGRMPLGRWPDENHHSMSLMQQFAINKIEQTLSDGGLYSVNGPPGTGKTTLLRDLVANNVVNRAEILASLASPDDAFSDEIRVNVSGNIKTLKVLCQELTGFEMVVASSNNAAVENITKELPQITALGEDFRDMAYLKPVAQKLAAEHKTDRNRNTIAALESEKDCWGLIAAALGKRDNRTRFGERVVFKPTNKLEAEGASRNYRTLIPALKSLAEGRDPGRDFKRAQREFVASRRRVLTLQEELARLEGLNEQAARLARLNDEIRVLRNETSRLEMWIKVRQTRRVGFLPLKRWIRHRALVKRLSEKQQKAELDAERIENRVKVLSRHFTEEQKDCKPLKERFKDTFLDSSVHDLEWKDVQRSSFGHGVALNQARSKLTRAAFELHQAWLVAAYSNGLLGDSLFLLMPAVNGRIEDRQAARALWQLFFLIVPVVSSTFAALSRQFSTFQAGELGWIFIDEAGQASPQQAVGALWRAKRAVVVGDPLQIEPVFTTPPEVVEAMARGEFGDDWFRWSPTVTSVQVIADQACPYGTQQISDDLWVGSPLRVHRRCGDPMFSVANRIAYNNTMLHGSDSPCDDAGSVWLDVDGVTQGRHFVPAHAEVVARLLREHVEQESGQPSIYIISPFKAVARGIRTYLLDHCDPGAFGGRHELQKWLRERVGTVHTFQGKEEQTVILVLGLSQQSPGAADWASSKPNLLNVALTRSKYRIYVVGSRAIWASRQYFSELDDRLGAGQEPEEQDRLDIP